MLKILNAWKANPSHANAVKVLRYDNKHPMALIMLTSQEQALVASAIYQANFE